MEQEQRASEHIKVKIKVPHSDGSDTLTLTNVKDDDAGRYYCRVKNSQGEREVAADVTLMGTSISWIRFKRSTQM